jgi:hypothetical protein
VKMEGALIFSARDNAAFILTAPALSNESKLNEKDVYAERLLSMEAVSVRYTFLTNQVLLQFNDQTKHAV